MGVENFIERLEKPEDRVMEIPVTEVELKKVVDKSDSASEVSDKEIKALKVKLSQLEETQQRDGQDMKEQLNTIVAELRGEIKASPAIIQSEQILDTLEKVQQHYNEEKAENEAARCPKCGALVGWGSQVREIPEREFDKDQARVADERPAWAFSRLFDFDSIFGKPPMIKVRQCPACGYTEKVEEEEAGEEQG